MPQPHALVHAVVVQVLQLHQQRETHVRHTEPLGHPRRILELRQQRLLELGVPERDLRRPVVHLYLDAACVAETDMVRHPVRIPALRNQPHAKQQALHLIVAARDPDVYVAELPRKRLRIQPGIGQPLQHHASVTALREHLRIAGSHLVHTAIHAADSLDREQESPFLEGESLPLAPAECHLRQRAGISIRLPLPFRLGALPLKPQQPTANVPLYNNQFFSLIKHEFRNLCKICPINIFFVPHNSILFKQRE